MIENLEFEIKGPSNIQDLILFDPTCWKCGFLRQHCQCKMQSSFSEKMKNLFYIFRRIMKLPKIMHQHRHYLRLNQREYFREQYARHDALSQKYLHKYMKMDRIINKKTIAPRVNGKWD